MGIRTTTAVLNTSTGTQDISIPGAFGENPKGAILIYGGGADGVLTDHAGLSFGFTDGTNQNCIYTTSKDNVTTTVTKRGFDTLNLISMTDYDSTTDVLAEFDSWITDGVRINITNAPSVTRTVTVILFGGDDVVNVSTTDLDLGTGTSAVTETVGHRTDLMFVANATFNFPSTSFLNSVNSMSFGVFVNDGLNTQNAVVVEDKDGRTTTEAYNRYLGSSVAGQYGLWELAISNITTTSFDWTPSLNPADDKITYLSIELSSDVQAKLATHDSPTSTGDYSISGVGFRPDFAMMLLSNNTAVDTNDILKTSMSVSVIDADEQACMSWSSKDAVGTSVAKTRYESTAVSDLTDGDTGLHQGTFSSFDTDGFTLNFPTLVAGTARKWAVLSVSTADIVRSVMTNKSIQSGKSLTTNNCVKQNKTIQ